MEGAARTRREVIEQMLDEARHAAREECCGLLGGNDRVITAVFPATNALHSATEFEIAPQELFRIFRAMRAAGVKHLGIYHSHPTGENTPSARDIERAYYPDAVYFILSPRTDAQRPVRAFSIRGGVVCEVRVIEMN